MRNVVRALVLATTALLPQALAGEGTSGPEAVEWGKVAWRRNFDETLEAAKASAKPVFLLFDEVPG